MVDIDKMDFFFYIDILIYESKKKNKEEIEKYDRNGF